MQLKKLMALFVMSLLLVSCGKSGNGGSSGGTPPTAPAPIEYTLYSGYYKTSNQDGTLLEYGDLDKALEKEVTIIAAVDGRGCWAKAHVNKLRPNHYFMYVYGTNTFSANMGVCAELEGKYWVDLTSDYQANFRLIEE